MVKCIFGKENICTKENTTKHCDKCNEYIPVCKQRRMGANDYFCNRFNIRLGDVQKCKLKICNICEMNNPKDLNDLLWFFEQHTMQNMS